jgi:hypothetical protein
MTAPLLVWAPKDPDEVVKRFIDWTGHASWIEGDKIASSSFTLSTAAGMTIDSSTNDDNEVSIVVLSGGTAASRGKVLGEVVTDDGQTLQWTATILIRAR